MSGDAYVCQSKTILVAHKKGGGFVIPLFCRRTNGPGACPTCAGQRRERISLQIRSEDVQSFFWRRVDANEARKILERLTHTRARYKRLPQADGSVVIIADNNKRLRGEPLPMGESLKRLIAEIADTPKGVHQSGSARFGGKFSGVRPRKPAQDSTVHIIDGPSATVENYLLQAGIDLQPAKNGGGRPFNGTDSQNKQALRAIESDGIEVNETHQSTLHNNDILSTSTTKIHTSKVCRFGQQPGTSFPPDGWEGGDE